SVIDRVHYGGKRAHGSALARALDAERIGLRRHRMAIDLEETGIVRPRHGVIHERTRHHLPARLLVDHALHESLPRALRDASMHLTFDEQRIKLDADVV